MEENETLRAGTKVQICLIHSGQGYDGEIVEIVPGALVVREAGGLFVYPWHNIAYVWIKEE